MASSFGEWYQAQIAKRKDENGRPLSNRKFATKIGVSQGSIQKIIKGEDAIRRSTVIQYALYLGGDMVNEALVAAGYDREPCLSADPDQAFRERLGRRIRTVRENMQMTQEDLARLIGKERQVIRSYETGQSDILALTLVKIAEVVDLSVGDLLGETVNGDSEIAKRVPVSRHDLNRLLQAVRELAQAGTSCPPTDEPRPRSYAGNGSSSASPHDLETPESPADSPPTEADRWPSNGVENGA